MLPYKSLLVGVLLVTGCGTTIAVTKLNNSPKPLVPRAPEDVEIFVSGKPEKAFTEISLISSQQESELSSDSTPQIIQKMRIEAARQGCDALIISGQNDNTVGSTAGGTYSGSGGVYGSVTTLKGFHSSCIVYKQ
jgi:hypothetical protein